VGWGGGGKKSKGCFSFTGGNGKRGVCGRGGDAQLGDCGVNVSQKTKEKGNVGASIPFNEREDKKEKRGFSKQCAGKEEKPRGNEIIAK